MSGLGKYFNSTTTKGRANVAKATYASFAALYLFSRFRKRGHKIEDDHIEHKENDHSAKGLDEETHQHASDSKTEPEPSCPCKCNENAQASNGSGQHNNKGHDGENGHHNNSGHHGDHRADGTHGNANNHGHHNGKKNQQPDNDHHKSVDNVKFDQSQSLESSNPQPNTNGSDKSFFSYMDDSVITWGLP